MKADSIDLSFNSQGRLVKSIIFPYIGKKFRRYFMTVYNREVFRSFYKYCHNI